VTLAEYLLVLQRRWRTWVAGLALGIVVAGVVTTLAPVRYTAVAMSFVTVSGERDDGGSAIFQESQFAVQRMSSYTKLTSSPEVLEPVIKDLGLDSTARELKEMVSASSPPNTVLLELSATSGEPERAAEIANAVSRQLGQHIQELERPDGSENSNVKVTLTKPATVPGDPSSPRWLLNLLLGAVAGLTLGLVAAVLRHHLDRRIKSAEDIRSLSGMSPLGSTLHERHAAKRPLVALDGRSASAEAYRTVRSGLKFATVDRDLRHFVISSPLAGDGKTTTACNLAISWSQTGLSVCLVEGDLRRPGVSRVLGMEGNVGLSDFLVGEARLSDVLVPWHDNMLTVLPAGSVPPDPAALLGSEAMHALVAELRERFDVVIYDSPPMLSVADAAVLSQAVDGLVLVVRAGGTDREDLATCLELVSDARLHLLGTILAGVKVRARAQAYYSSPLQDRPELLAQRAGRVRAAGIKSSMTSRTATQPAAEPGPDSASSGGPRSTPEPVDESDEADPSPGEAARRPPYDSVPTKARARG
jgi:capsular exopolysaccharide synthesis family protein